MPDRATAPHLKSFSAVHTKALTVRRGWAGQQRKARERERAYPFYAGGLGVYPIHGDADGAAGGSDAENPGVARRPTCRRWCTRSTPAAASPSPKRPPCLSAPPLASQQVDSFSCNPAACPILPSQPACTLHYSLRPSANHDDTLKEQHPCAVQKWPVLFFAAFCIQPYSGQELNNAPLAVE